MNEKTLNNRYEFVLLFDVENGNPNGDPDAGNMPRIDAETGLGLVTDVCLKRKIRNYVELVKAGEPGYDIYVREGVVLNQLNKEAYDHHPEIELKESKEDRIEAKKKDDQLTLARWMCKKYFDIRTFGAVMTTGVNCGQVRGPVQLTFSKSIDPINPTEVSITRMAVTNEKDIEKERTMGRKAFVPYGLYRLEGYISAPLAQQTGFSEEDLELLWTALINMFEHDRSAARGKMASQKLFVFKHDTALGNAPANKLFQLVQVQRKDGVTVPRSFNDYEVTVGTAPQGVAIIEML
ncbi:CRISPR-associated protein Cas7/Csd2, subtype I-C/DVULG [Thermobacillus composti KWC4]|uniref:CRISPR-associated protein Cas7/Csd2, subtype I-C/DVULG n=1 Tax=Thermobacillus composti (strain DSM 18247 / JCM 13945 / KWC4) TaxID=717605 RepID=L0EG97_THECK|nr:type I-C CRISPR-associated protein Cas7/Csd2 [Thermobacillus composti]AGA59293.1 CRISPR-associated protein Cas7/Csd2, subtype I-C/DVULG [Thermobacillus composti KWC4]